MALGRSLRREIGVIFQDYVTYFLSARENIGGGRLDAADDFARIEAAAGQSGADGRGRGSSALA